MLHQTGMIEIDKKYWDPYSSVSPLTIASGEKTPNCTFLILLNRHFECVKFKLGFDDMADPECGDSNAR